jgi:rubredoxin
VRELAGLAVARFEGSSLGDAAKLAPHTKLECKVCWHVYDPAAGDPVWQIPAGTPFDALPAHWTCPNCSAEKAQFLVLQDEP